MNNMRRKIANLLVNAGFRNDLSGYDWAVDGIEFVLTCKLSGESKPTMNTVYYEIGERHKDCNLTYSRIERNIRYLLQEWIPCTEVYSRPCKDLVENLQAAPRLYPRSLIFGIANYLYHNEFTNN